MKWFIKEHSSDAAVYQQETKEQRKEKIRNAFRCTNKFINAFLESSGDEQETKQSDLVNQ